ncbi:MAG TPA: hypothetical protein VKT78_07175 [Fimbriimonadaceae bacterium]|nr:hypothetical protein [Fimbriimonadaceae bacterium]
MTTEKARDFFSAYHEGSLDTGLRLSFEQKLNADAELRAEYDRFAATLDQLSKLRETPIEIPFDLNERIGARLDRHLWEQKQVAPKAWFMRLRLVTFAGLATVLLVGAVISIKNHRGTTDGPIPAGPFGTTTGSNGDQLTISMKQDQPVVYFSPQAKKTVVFRIEPGMTPFAETTVDKNLKLERTLENKNPETDLLNIQVLDAPKTDQAIIAIPGTHPENVATGTGTLEEFAKALAGKYRVPVWLNGIKDPLVQVNWDFKETDARRAADAALKGQFTVDLREGNLITISGG